MVCMAVLLAGAVGSLSAQVRSPKREFRGAWISVVANIDWPVAKGLSAADQRRTLVEMVDSLHRIGMNAVFFQVRPQSDAVYSSAMEPWSEWLSGQQGAAPGFDPLEVLIEACHARQMEAHAWFNPFRAVLSDKSHLTEAHVSYQHPEWVIAYAKGRVLDPGHPEVRRYVTEVVLDVAKRYDVDGIHFDDYFYPYPVRGEPFRDSLSYARYGQGWTDRAAWRRSNIDAFIQTISANLRETKNHLKFGVSPFGVWRNQQSDLLGSATKAGIPSYDSIYADTRRWMQEGWVDYILPQLYWSRTFPAASYEVLADWWTQNRFGRHLYIGHAAYKVNANSDSAWYRPSEIPSQLALNRRKGSAHIQGSAFFSAKVLLQNPNGLCDSLRTQWYAAPALLPLMPWKDDVAPQAPRRPKVRQTPAGPQIRWKKPRKAIDGEAVYRYIVYRFDEDQTEDLEDTRRIAAVLQGDRYTWTDPQPGRRQRYVITALDRLQNESPPSKTIRSK